MLHWRKRFNTRDIKHIGIFWGRMLPRAHSPDPSPLYAEPA